MEEVDDEILPWLYDRGQPFRVVASLEAAGTLAGLEAFLPLSGPRDEAARLPLGGASSTW